MPKLDDAGEVFARLSMLEFVLEIVLGSELAIQDEQAARRFKEALIEQSKKGYGPITADPEKIAYMQALMIRSNEMMEQFVKKVTRREAEVREIHKT